MNWHTIVKIYNNFIFIIKFLIFEKMFKMTLDFDLKNNGKIANISLF